MHPIFLLSAFCAALATAGPIAEPQPISGLEIRDIALDRRAPQQTKNYKAVIAVEPNLVADDWYVFTQTWPLNTLASPEGQSKETKEDIAKVRADLKYDHIALVVGQVTNPTGWLRFDGNMWELGKKEATMTSPIDLWHDAWVAPKSKPLAYVGQTTKAKVDEIETWNTQYKTAHPNYDGATNNCGDYVAYLKAKLV